MPGPPRHVHLLSMHTSPLAQPGVGDAGGMNVYVAHLAAELAAGGIPVTLWAARLSETDPPRRRLADRLEVRHVTLPGLADPDKNQLRHHVGAFADAIVAGAGDGSGQVVHAHYWLSAVAGAAVADRLGVPLVTSLHTSALVKNLHASVGETPEPDFRIAGERYVVGASDALVVNTPTEARQLHELYRAPVESLHVITPGIDPHIHHPAREDPRDAVDAAAAADARVEILMAARLQPLKGPELLIEAIRLLAPDRLPVHLTIVGDGDPDYLAHLRRLVARYALDASISIVPAVPGPLLADRMRAADIVAVPSSSETFGLVALEAQACATPVVASRIDGLTDAVRDRRTGVLVADRTPRAWADALRALVLDPARRRALGRAGAVRAAGMTWAVTAERIATVYASVLRHGHHAAVPVSTADVPACC
ncbi:glycosyltransferase [Raineyella sp. LH-20]|uniref:glycosyltransferase n=1 Tax=Raineyella sp. LH-20 TaxID=3081204 RepID=UPI002954C1FF|nr:glycosyltransferase [Raineyella sp. LH-20]WOP17769.1 glycosyltransferase [Raineyella sp. LH-20]